MLRMSSPEVTQADRCGFEEWLARSSSNRAMWDRLSRSVGPLDIAARHQGRAGAFARRVGAHQAGRRQVLRGIIALGGFAALSTLVDRFVPLSELTADHLTLTGQRKTFDVADGSKFVLGPRTAVNATFDDRQRDIRLLDGEIWVDAIANRRIPVALDTGAMTLHAEGGTFVSRRTGGIQTIVAVDASGDVDCGVHGRQSINAGQCLSFDGAAVVRRPAKITTETAWVDGELVVNEETLSYVAERMRPYYHGLLRLDPAIAGRLVTGSFPLSNVGAAMETIGSVLDLSVSQTPFWIMVGPRTSRA